MIWCVCIFCAVDLEAKLEQEQARGRKQQEELNRLNQVLLEGMRGDSVKLGWWGVTIARELCLHSLS